MTDRDIVERVGRIFERAVIRLKPKEPHHRIPYATAIRGSGAVELMRAVRPHMGVLRRPQIDRAIASWNGTPARHRSMSTSLKSRFRQEEITSAESEVAWISGLLEGEGTFRIVRSGLSAYPSVSLEMSDETVVRRAAHVLGAPSVAQDEPRDDRWNVTFVAAISGHAAADWMRRLRPYMGRRRQAAIDAALAAYRPIRLVAPPLSCVVPGCSEPHRSRGLCHKHYMAWSRDIAKGKTPRVTPLR